MLVWLIIYPYAILVNKSSVHPVRFVHTHPPWTKIWGVDHGVTISMMMMMCWFCFSQSVWDWEINWVYLCFGEVTQLFNHLISFPDGSIHLLDPMPLSRHNQKEVCSALVADQSSKHFVWRSPTVWVDTVFAPFLFIRKIINVFSCHFVIIVHSIYINWFSIIFLSSFPTSNVVYIVHIKWQPSPG